MSLSEKTPQRRFAMDDETAYHAVTSSPFFSTKGQGKSEGEGEAVLWSLLYTPGHT